MLLPEGVEQFGLHRRWGDQRDFALPDCGQEPERLFPEFFGQIELDRDAGIENQLTRCLLSQVRFRPWTRGPP